MRFLLAALVCSILPLWAGPVEFGRAELEKAIRDRGLRLKMEDAISPGDPESYAVNETRVTGADPRGLMYGLLSAARPDALIEIHLNGGALEQAGTSLEAGAERVYQNIYRSGWALNPPRPVDHNGLRVFPTTWAKRLAFGRDPRAMRLVGKRAVK